MDNQTNDSHMTTHLYQGGYLDSKFYTEAHSNLTSTVDNVTSGNVAGVMSVFKEDPYQKFQSIAHVSLAVINIILSPLVLLFNVTVIVVMTKFNFFDKKTNIFVTSLSLADCFIGAFTLPLYTGFYLNPKLANLKYPCLFKFMSVLFSLSSSILNLTALGLDRYLAIIKPLKYPLIMTHRKAWTIIGCIWIYNLSIIIIAAFWNYYDSNIPDPCNYFRIFPLPFTVQVTFVTIFTCLATTCFFYWKIFKTAAEHRQRRLQRASRSSDCSSRRFEKIKASAKNMAFMFFLFIALWTPFLLTGPLKYMQKYETLIETIKNISLVFAMGNSVLNPIVYCWIRKDFKAALQTLLDRSLGRKKSCAKRSRMKPTKSDPQSSSNYDFNTKNSTMLEGIGYNREGNESDGITSISFFK